MEPTSILAISSSPRRGGNSETLLDRAIAGAESLGADVEKVNLCDFKVAPCRECGGCNQTGKCVVPDDFQQFYLKFFAVDRIILATPVFFMGVAAQAKALIDRTQSVWVRKYVLKQRIPAREGFARRGYMISVGGSGLEHAFDCCRMTAKYWFMTLDMEYKDNVEANSVDNKGDIDKHEDKLQEAFELGMRAARTA